jgi:hypothetical protein
MGGHRRERRWRGRAVTKAAPEKELDLHRPTKGTLLRAKSATETLTWRAQKNHLRISPVSLKSFCARAPEQAWRKSLAGAVAFPNQFDGVTGATHVLLLTV